MAAEKTPKQNVVRLPADIYQSLVAEAERNRIDKPAIQARMFLTERIQRGDLQPLVDISQGKYGPFPARRSDPRINIRLSESEQAEVDVIISLFDGNFSALVQSVLIERYVGDFQYKQSNHATYLCHYDVAWVPIASCITAEMKRKIKAALEAAASEKGFSISEVEVTSDHVRVLVDASPRFSIDSLVKLLMTRSTEIFKMKFPGLESAWNPHYFVSTVGNAAPPEYIRNFAKRAFAGFDD
jgi:REP element-mobilizing transposase RayT